MDVSMCELRQHLSEYLRRVSAGEIIRVINRGVPTAIISPIVGSDPLQRGTEEGWIRPARHQHRIGAAPRARANRRSLDVLGEDRKE
jgi:prevent-host-death family protein